MTKYLVLILFFIALITSTSGQSLSYNVVKSGDNIGSMEVSRKVINGEEHFSVKSTVKFKILFSFIVEYSLQEIFVDGILDRGEGFNTFNGSTQKETSIKRIANGEYRLLIDGIEGYVKDRSIKESVSKLYYQEPTGNMELYSQYFGQYISLQRLGNHQFKLLSPDGENIYTYENGVVKTVRISRDFATFSFELKPESMAAVKKGNQ